MERLIKYLSICWYSNLTIPWSDVTHLFYTVNFFGLCHSISLLCARIQLTPFTASQIQYGMGFSLYCVSSITKPTECSVLYYISPTIAVPTIAIPHNFHRDHTMGRPYRIQIYRKPTSTGSFQIHTVESSGGGFASSEAIFVRM